MAVPDYQSMMAPLLREMESGVTLTTAEIRSALTARFHLTEEDLAEWLPSKRAKTFDNRVAWAITYLKNAGLLQRPRRGSYQITARGREFLASHPDRVDIKALNEFPEFREFAEQIEALLDAAGSLDAEARDDRRATCRRALVATLVFAGLRIGEAAALRWRDVDLAAGRLDVGHAKTDAGVRRVDLLPVLRDELATAKAAARETRPASYAFPTGEGNQQLTGNLRSRIVAKAVARANEHLAEQDLAALPGRLTPHALRRTNISLRLAIGQEVPYVMKQVGHTDPTVTLGIYANVMYRADGERERLRALVGTTADTARAIPAVQPVS